MKTVKKRARLLVAFSALCVAGCAGAPVYQTAPGLMYQTVALDSPAAFASVVEEAANAQRGPIMLTQHGDDPFDFQLDLDFRIRDKGLNNPDMSLAVMSFYFLNAYPASCAHYQFTLEADLLDANRNRLASWFLAEDDTAFTWFFSGADCKTPSAETVRKIAKDLLTELYARVASEGVLTAVRPSIVENQPLVHVQAWNAIELTERVTKTDAPFSNFVFTRPDPGMPHRTLTISFEFTNPQIDASVLLKHPLSALSLGMISNCASNTIVLEATVTNEHDDPVRNYQYRETRQPSNAESCGPSNDETDPDTVAKLLKQLYRDIGRDKIL